MITPIIVGFSGVAGSGKDEAARVALAVLEGASVPASQYSFAYPLKEVCKFIFQMTDEEMTNRDLKEQVSRLGYGMTNRRIMQLVGTESFRNVFNENIWIDVAERLISQSGSDVVVISDVRFENEAKWVKENGFLIHIDPTGREGFRAIESSDHPSEAGYTTVPSLVIQNNKSLDHFVSEVQKVVSSTVVPTYKSIAKQIQIAMEDMRTTATDIKASTLAALNEDI